MLLIYSKVITLYHHLKIKKLCLKQKIKEKEENNLVRTKFIL